MQWGYEPMLTSMTPLDLGRLVEQAMRFYVRNVAVCLGISATAMVVPAGAASLVASVASRGPASLSVAAIVSLFLAAAVTVAVGLVLYCWMTGALLFAALEIHKGRPVGVGDAYAHAWEHFPRLLMTQLRAALPIAGLCLTVIGIPWGIYLVVRWLFVQQIAYLEGCEPSESLARSSALVTNQWRRTGGRFAAFVVIAGGVLFGCNSLPVLGGIGGAVLSAPVLVLGTTFMFYDAQLRFDRAQQGIVDDPAATNQVPNQVIDEGEWQPPGDPPAAGGGVDP